MMIESWLCCPYEITDPRHAHLALRQLERRLSVYGAVDILSVTNRPRSDYDRLSPCWHIIREITVVFRHDHTFS